MKVTVSHELLEKFAMLSIEGRSIATQITKITNDYTALKIFSPEQFKLLKKDDVCRLMVGKEEDNSIHLFSVRIDSLHKFDEEMFVFVKPLTTSKEVNRRRTYRLSTGLYFGKAIVSNYRSFPPIDKKWQRGEVLDVSEGGAKITGKEYFSKGQLIEIFLKSPILQEDEVILTRVVNIYKEDRRYIYSLQFLNLSLKQLEHLKKLIEKGQNQFKKSS